MKEYKIVYSDTITTKDLKKLSLDVLKEIKLNIENKLFANPEVFSKPLRKSLKGFRRMRVRNYRIIFKIDNDFVKIVFIGKKPDVYKKFLNKLSS